MQSTCHASRTRPTSGEPAPNWLRPDKAFERATELHKRKLISQQMLDDADTTLRAEDGRL